MSTTRETQSRRRHVQPGINLTPLLDAIFNLLFFFLLVTTLRSDEVATEIELPTSDMAGTAGSDAPTVVVDEEGRIFFQNRELVEEELELELLALRKTGTKEITVRGDGEANYKDVYRIIDICRRVGLEAISLQADRAGPGAGPDAPPPR